METKGSNGIDHPPKSSAHGSVQDLEPNEKSHSTEAYPDYRRLNRLDRYIRFVPTLAFDITLQCAWEAVALTFQAGLYNGGPTALVYGLLLSWAGSVCLAASLGEMASVNPTVGAQYRWTALYAPRGIMTPAFWGLVQGWITVFGWISTCAQAPYINGTIIQGLVIYNNPDYVPERWHGTLLAWAILAIPVFCNIFARRILPAVEVMGIITHVLFFLPVVLVLVILARRSSAEFVFETSISGISGWTNPGVSWCIGLLSAAFPLACFDGVLHMSDEVKNAERRIPQSMVASVAVNGILAFSFMICILFTLGDLDQALSTPTGYPIIESLDQATGSKAATTVLVSFMLFNSEVALFSSLASVSRLTWAFARDHGLPFSEFFGRVHPTLRIPLNALGLLTVIVVLLSLINIGSTTAFFAILSLSTLSLYISYIIPITFILLKKLRREHITYGPFKLGKIGIPINLFALVYAIYISIWLPFPPTQPVTAENMNYGGPVVGAVIVLAIVDWFISGKRRFVVPVKMEEAEMEQMENDSGRSN